jgi:hypothetical protein
MSFETLSPEFRDSLRKMAEKLDGNEPLQSEERQAVVDYFSKTVEEFYEDLDKEEKKVFKALAKSNPGFICMMCCGLAVAGNKDLSDSEGEDDKKSN